MKILVISFLLGTSFHVAESGEKNIASLRDFRDTEMKSIGIRVSKRVTLRVRGLGGSSEWSWMSHGDGMFSYGWIIDGRTRLIVWEMNARNTSSASDDDRSCDDKITLEPGEYEVYFSAPVFALHRWTNHLAINIDHRRKPLFGKDEDGEGLWFLKGFWSDDLPEIWERRAKRWGIDLFADARDRSSVETFTAPAKEKNIVFDATQLGDDRIIRQGLRVTKTILVDLYAVGEETDGDLVDYGWMVKTDSREPVWEMTPRNVRHAGGADKNVMSTAELRLQPGSYVLYYITDDSHSMDDWNLFPPADPYHWGVTVSVPDASDSEYIRPYSYKETENVIVAITRVGSDEYREEGFSLRKDATVRVYAIGERGYGKRNLADYGYIMDARTREKVWSMDVDHCRHAGGASKNVAIDQVISLPKGSYLVVYTTDDSHSYGDWNANPPFDKEYYGITVMGAGTDFDPRVVGKFVDSRAEGMIAQIIRVRDDSDESRKFSIKRPTRVRIYAIGEGEKRSMFDYGWIERSDTKSVVWEMTYSMTFHAGGARKNRMVNTSILLEAGDYTLRFVSDDSHAYGSWNMDPPEDQQYWGISLYEDDSDLPKGPSAPPAPPEPRLRK